MNKQVIYSLGLGTVILTAFLLLLGKAIFGIDTNTNMFSTGITPGAVLGIANGVTAWWIYKKYL